MNRTHLTRSASALFEPTRAGAFKLANRIVMAPLTRNRAGPGLVPVGSHLSITPSAPRQA
jgi:N-ethylmaleimide reductase